MPEAHLFEPVLLLALLAVRTIAEYALVPPRWDTRRPTPGRGLVTLALLAVAFVASAAAVLWGLYRHGAASMPLYGAGLALLVAGYLGRLACVRQLGTAYSQSFETDPKGRLVTHGLYSAVRHPVYSFYLLELAALLVAWPNLVSAAALVLGAGLSLYRIRKEEAELLTSFGDEYASYRRRTRALIPYLL